MSKITPKTLVVGASENPARYSYRAIKMLREHAEPTEALGLKAGEVAGVSFETDWDVVKAKGPFETVALYVGPRNQEPIIDHIIALAPKRVIFNPGTEHPLFIKRLRENGIEPVMACTLVMLRTGQYALT